MINIKEENWETKLKKWKTRWTKTGNREAEMVAKFKLVKLTIIFLRRLLVPTFDK